MLNLIKKEIKIIIKNETNNIFKHIIIFLVMYLGMNDISYSGISILISYLIVVDMFYISEQERKIKGIRLLPNTNVDDVYTRYIVATIMIISTNIIMQLVINLLSNILFRRIVFNDIVFSINVYLIIMSLILPIFFKYGYYKARFSSGVIGIVIYCVYGAFLNMFNNRIYENAYFEIYKESITLNEYVGTFSKIINDIVYSIDFRYLNLYIVTIISILLFIVSMYISIRITEQKNL